MNLCHGRRLTILLSSVICFEMFILIFSTVSVTRFKSQEIGIRKEPTLERTPTSETKPGIRKAPTSEATPPSESTQPLEPTPTFEQKLLKIRDRLMAKAKDEGYTRSTTNGGNIKTALRQNAATHAEQPLLFRPLILTEQPDINSKVVVLVPSHTSSFIKRQAIRETWKAAAEKANTTATILFVIGHSDCLGSQADLKSEESKLENPSVVNAANERTCEDIEHDFLKLEQDQYHDLLEIPIVEAYTLLPEKMVQAYHYVISKFDRVEWIAKADDDMFVNVRNLERYLMKFNPNVPMVIGEIVHDSEIAQEGKWADLEYIYASGNYVYPDWPRGSAGHVLSRSAVKYIVDNSEHLYRYQGEDTNIGIWMDGAILKDERVVFVNAQEIFGSLGKKSCLDTPFKYGILGHDFSPNAMFICQIRSDLNNDVQVVWEDVPIIYSTNYITN